MWRPNSGSGKTRPLRIKPERGKITEHGSESEGNKAPDVFQEDRSRSNDATDADDFVPHVAASRIVNSCPTTGERIRLARETRCDAIHSAGVFGWIEQPNIDLEHAQAGEPSLCGSLSENLAAVSIPLNSGNWRVSEDEIGEQSAAGACKEVEGSHFTASSLSLPCVAWQV
jgi:hypothetical protein